MDYYNEKTVFLSQIKGLIKKKGDDGTDLKLLFGIAMETQGYGARLIKEFCDYLVAYQGFKYDETQETIYPPPKNEPK